MSLQNNISVVLGQKGCGKTSLVRMLLLKEMRKRNRLIILDTLGEYGEITPQTLPVTFDGLAKYTKNPQFRLRYIPKTEAELDAALSQAWLASNVLVAIDESGRWCSPAYMSPGMSSLLNYGRHKRLDAILVARRSIELHRTTTSQADTFYLFHSHEPRDTAYVSASISSDVADVLPTLGRYEYVKFSYPSDLSRGKTQPIPSTPGINTKHVNSWLD